MGIADGFVGHLLVLVLPHLVRRASIVHRWVASLVQQERHLSIVGIVHTPCSYVVVWCPNIWRRCRGHYPIRLVGKN